MASRAGQWLGAQTDRVGRVQVAPDQSVPSDPDVFVIGDCDALDVRDRPFAARRRDGCKADCSDWRTRGLAARSLARRRANASSSFKVIRPACLPDVMRFGSAENDEGVTDTMRLSRTLIDCVR